MVRAGLLPLAAVAGLAFASGAFAGAATPPHPGPPPKLFAFLSGGGTTGIEHLQRYGSRISVLAPNWYQLDPADQTLAGGPDPKVIVLARARGTQLWPVVNARLGTGETLPADVRAGIVDAVATEALGRRYRGVTIDIEQLAPDQSGAFTALIRGLERRLHAQGQRLAVYVPWRTGEAGEVQYDWRALEHACDLLITSGYDQHSAGSAPGPISSPSFFKRMVAYAASLSRFHLVPALGAFGYSWPAGGGPGELLSTLDGDALLHQTGAPVHGASGSAEFSAGGRVIYYETAAGLIDEARIAREQGMRWLAMFSLGREPAAFWRAITTARQAPASISSHDAA